MAIPDYQSIMLPLLELAADKREHSLREAVDSLASVFDLSQEELKERLPSGQQEVFINRVGWARTYLKKAGLLQSVRRGHFQITDRGLETLAKRPVRIDVKFLDQFGEFQEFRSLKRAKADAPDHCDDIPNIAPDTLAMATAGVYDAAQILARQERWQEEEARAEERTAQREREEEMLGHYPEPYLREARRLGRNAPCHCGRGKKCKKCCLPADEARAATQRVFH